MKPVAAFIGLLSSGRFLFWAATAWLFYYVTSAVWTEEAFAGFVASLSTNPVTVFLFVLFLASLALNIAFKFAASVKSSPGRAVARSLFPLGVMIFLLGFLLSASFRQMEWTVLQEGSSFSPQWSSEELMIKEIRTPIQEETLISDLSGTFFRYEPRAVISQGGQDYDVGAFPPSRIGGTRYHILMFGLAPGLELSRSGETIDRGNISLRIIPPGNVDQFEIKPYPYKFHIRIEPTRIIRKGSSRLKTYDLAKPLYGVKVVKGDTVLFDATSDEPIMFDEFRLGFTAPRDWVLVEMARDPGAYFIIAGLAAILAGIPLLCAEALLAKRKKRSVVTG